MFHPFLLYHHHYLPNGIILIVGPRPLILFHPIYYHHYLPYGIKLNCNSLLIPLSHPCPQITILHLSIVKSCSYGTWMQSKNGGHALCAMLCSTARCTLCTFMLSFLCACVLCPLILLHVHYPLNNQSPFPSPLLAWLL